jgi:tRNA1(Val) A37 N6-methylase TrmN6
MLSNDDDSPWQKWSDLIRRSDDGEDIVLTEQVRLLACQNSATDALPPWLPRQGEELCKLNGDWRILQRVGGHRWTTDDLLTAYIAVRETTTTMSQLDGQAKGRPIRYLDLGTGNGSVLQMTTRALLQQGLVVCARAIEARREAVALATRSLQFNVGPDFNVEIVHGDFRDVLTTATKKHDATTTTMPGGTFDLVTGTPPYFRVDFHVQGDAVTSAVIRQGGMPTARQSAPARCEFRGGIEAYCEAASHALVVERGRFVVCENFLNHERVLVAAQDAGLLLLRCVQVQGRKGRPPLFCVYVMKKPFKENSADGVADRAFEEETIAVRDDDGNWTRAYTETVFATMSIPQFAPDRTPK